MLLRPVISEKSTLETERNNYTFAVARDANKFLIKAAVEAEFKVTVLDVRVDQRAPEAEAARPPDDGHRARLEEGRRDDRGRRQDRTVRGRLTDATSQLPTHLAGHARR